MYSEDVQSPADYLHNISIRKFCIQHVNHKCECCGNVIEHFYTTLEISPNRRYQNRFLSATICEVCYKLFELLVGRDFIPNDIVLPSLSCERTVHIKGVILIDHWNNFRKFFAHKRDMIDEISKIYDNNV